VRIGCCMCCIRCMHCRQQLHSRSSSAGHEQELNSLRDALQDADTQKASAQERIRATLKEVLLQPEEVEAAALQCAWLAHYWVSIRASFPGRHCSRMINSAAAAAGVATAWPSRRVCSCSRWSSSLQVACQAGKQRRSTVPWLAHLLSCKSARRELHLTSVCSVVCCHRSSWS
jgi:hypothetical protein